jgi:hypothetical protein
MAGPCEYSDEPSRSINCYEFIDWLGNYKCLKVERAVISLEKCSKFAPRPTKKYNQTRNQ